MRLNPPSYDEFSIAVHESAHAVVALLLDHPFLPDEVSITDGPDGWRGYLSYSAAGPEYMPDSTCTPPNAWKKSVEAAWASLVIGYAGPAATRRHDGQSLDAEGIRGDLGGNGDEANAQEAARHFWPQQHREQILNAAAELAGLLVQIPRIWSAIEAVAGYLIQNARHAASAAELETIVRRWLPVSVTCPETDWALSLADV